MPHVPAHRLSASPPSTTHRSAGRCQRAARWLPLLALICAQWLGLIHGVLDARVENGLAAQPERAAWTCTSPDDGAAAQPHGWLKDLFGGGHHHANDCRLYDHAANGHAAPLGAILPALPPLPPASQPRWQPSAWAAATLPPFLARAPPLPG